MLSCGVFELQSVSALSRSSKLGNSHVLLLLLEMSTVYISLGGACSMVDVNCVCRLSPVMTYSHNMRSHFVVPCIFSVIKDFALLLSVARCFLHASGLTNVSLNHMTWNIW